MTASRVSQDPQRRFRVFQEDTYISMDYMTRKAMVLKRNKIGLARKDVELDEKNALAAELADFIDAVKATKASGKVVDPKVSGEQGLRALRVAIAIENEIRAYNDKYGFKFAPCSQQELEASDNAAE
jgi:predicted dehydrogenase